MIQRMQPLRVALVHHRDARDVRNWSGTLFFSKLAFERHVGPVLDLSPAPVSLLPFRVARQLIRRTTGKWYSYEHDLDLARVFGRYFTRRVAEEKPDLIFAPASSACLGFLETTTPIVYFSDATWRVMEGYYPEFSNVLARSSRGGEELERRAIERSALALFSSDWASESAIRDYGADPAKVATVYLGANLHSVPAREAVLPKELGSPVRLLLVGISWERKGGQIALETLLRLLESGVDAELTVVGCGPPRGVSHPRLRVIPFLNKGIPEERERFERLWREADFLLLPTRYEASAVVYCEAGANALPALTTRTGGVSSLVVDGRNGYTLPLAAGGEEYAAVIRTLVENPAEYRRLCESSREEFEQRLNWDSWGARVARLIEERLPQFRGRTRSGLQVKTA